MTLGTTTTRRGQTRISQSRGWSVGLVWSPGLVVGSVCSVGCVLQVVLRCLLSARSYMDRWWWWYWLAGMDMSGHASTKGTPATTSKQTRTRPEISLQWRNIPHEDVEHHHPKIIYWTLVPCVFVTDQRTTPTTSIIPCTSSSSATTTAKHSAALLGMLDQQRSKASAAAEEEENGEEVDMVHEIDLLLGFVYLYSSMVRRDIYSLIGIHGQPNHHGPYGQEETRHRTCLQIL